MIKDKQMTSKNNDFWKDLFKDISSKDFESVLKEVQNEYDAIKKSVVVETAKNTSNKIVNEISSGIPELFDYFFGSDKKKVPDKTSCGGCKTNDCNSDVCENKPTPKEQIVNLKGWDEVQAPSSSIRHGQFKNDVAINKENTSKVPQSLNKIQDEMERLTFAYKQDNKIEQINIMSNLILAVSKYAQTLGIELSDLIKMASITDKRNNGAK